MSPIMLMMPSICSASRTSSGKWSLISANVRNPRSLPSTMRLFSRRLRASTSAGVSTRGAISACLPFLPLRLASSARLPAILAAISPAVGLWPGAAAATAAPFAPFPVGMTGVTGLAGSLVAVLGVGLLLAIGAFGSGFPLPANFTTLALGSGFLAIAFFRAAGVTTLAFVLAAGFFAFAAGRAVLFGSAFLRAGRADAFALPFNFFLTAGLRGLALTGDLRTGFAGFLAMEI